MKTIILSNGERIAYREYGEGAEALVMIHGNICSGKHIEDFSRFFTVDGFRIIIPDLRGFGDSSYNRPIVEISDFSQDLEDFFSQLGLKKLALLGWSAGGCVCMDYVYRYPQRVQRLILVDSVGINGCPMYDETGAKYRSVEDIRREKTQVAPALQAIQKQDIAYMKSLWDNAIYLRKKPKEEAADQQAKASLKQRNLPEMYLALSNFDLTAKGPSPVPVMILFGSDDNIVPRQDILLTAKLLGAKTCIGIPDCGHSPFTDCPGYLARQIKDFI